MKKIFEKKNEKNEKNMTTIYIQQYRSDETSLEQQSCSVEYSSEEDRKLRVDQSSSHMHPSET